MYKGFMVNKELRALRGFFAPPIRQEKKNCFFTNLFLLVYNKNVKVSNFLYFYRCFGNKNGHQNRLK